ncbi:MAG: YggS family pyridoxal phosphate-dependent enzyme [Phycisphaerales bacterium]|nr:YggS family pyridoxal phosphate-dependent enzyme [Phycisphaerales bacterium]
MSTLDTRYHQVMERVARAAERSGRSPDRILTIAVTKYADLEQVRRLIALGHRDLGENQVQQLAQRAAIIEEHLSRERTLRSVSAARSRNAGLLFDDREPALLSRDEDLPTPPPAPGGVRWHMIGHLQRNKAKKVIDFARLIHSVDSLRLVEELQAVAFKRDRVVEVLVQVNCSGEKSKHGCPVAAARHLAEQIDSMVHLRVRGLMTMAPYSDNPEDSRPTFERCADLYEDIRRDGVGGRHFNILSMGMSNDFEVAIECGANCIRVGSAIFGEPAHRDHSDDGDEG